MEKTRVLMICMGNICRSPTAEAVLRAKLKQAGLDKVVEVASAGTHGHYHAGESPDPRACKAAATRGYDLSRIRARRLVEDDFHRHHHVLAMDDDNLAALQRALPAGAAAHVALLLDHAVRFKGERAVPDPYYGPATGFDRVLDLVEDACDGLVEALRRQHGTSAALG